MSTRRRFIARFAAILVLAGLAPAGLNLAAPSLAYAEGGPTIFAAASLKNALDDVNAAWKSESGRSATISYAASSALAKQIESGAPADIFISADLAWMDYLAKKSLIQAASRVTLLGNSLVLVAPKDSPAQTVIARDFGLKALLGGGKLAMGSVDSVPAGKYGKAALTALGVWDGVKDDVAQAENVRAALLLVSRGEAALGIVYKTDVAADPGVKIVGTFPEASHEPIVYPAALTTVAKSGEAAAFLTFLQTAKARTLFEAEGFTVLATPSN